MTPPISYRVKCFLSLSLILRFDCIELDFKEISYLVVSKMVSEHDHCNLKGTAA